eukprot:g16402.t1
MPTGAPSYCFRYTCPADQNTSLSKSITRRLCRTRNLPEGPWLESSGPPSQIGGFTVPHLCLGFVKLCNRLQQKHRNLVFRGSYLPLTF